MMYVGGADFWDKLEVEANARMNSDVSAPTTLKEYFTTNAAWLKLELEVSGFAVKCVSALVLALLSALLLLQQYFWAPCELATGVLLVYIEWHARRVLLARLQPSGDNGPPSVPLLAGSYESNDSVVLTLQEDAVAYVEHGSGAERTDESPIVTSTPHGHWWEMSPPFHVNPQGPKSDSRPFPRIFPA